MPWGSWINELPTEFFLVVHIAAFAAGAAFVLVFAGAVVQVTLGRPALGVGRG